jgi:V/A-type H+/Na+-transporting ATPase subunit E
MQNKLQELTDKLYNEGLSKGRQDAEEMKSKAKTEAASIIKEANAKAKEIIANAEKEAKELTHKTENDIIMASSQTISKIKQEVENAIVSEALINGVNSSINDVEFLKSIILEIVKSFNPANSEPVALDIILPASIKAQLEEFMKDKIAAICNKGIEIQFSNDLVSGFKIGPSAGGYKISFAGDDFQKILSEYLRPKTKTLLFGK